MGDIRIYRPRAFLRMFVPIERASSTEVVAFEVPVLKAQFESNDHTKADKLTTTLDWSTTGVDPRWLRGATCEFYLGNADDFGNLTPSALDRDNLELRNEFGLKGEPNQHRAYLRFVGQLVKPARKLKGNSLSVELEWQDYTAFFLVAKPFATAGVPQFSENLGEAWARICAHVPGAADLAAQIELRGLPAFPVLGEAVAQRFRKRGGLTVDPKTDAWAVWQQAVGSMGLISYIHLDRCIVTTATDYYTADHTPRFVYGKNLLDFTEQRHDNRVGKGVGITSFDPLTGQALEALYPSPNDPRMTSRHPKKVGAKKRKKGAPVLDKKDYDFFPYPGVTDPEILQRIAERVYDERIRQELEGTIVTADLTAETVQGGEFDLLHLRAGDTVEVRFIEAGDVDFVKKVESEGERVAYLVAHGYTETIAQLIAGNVEKIGRAGNLFYCKSVKTTLESNPDDASFRIEIDYCNKIDLTAGAIAA